MSQDRPARDRLQLILAVIVTVFVWETLESMLSLRLVRSPLRHKGNGDLAATVVAATKQSHPQVIATNISNPFETSPPSMSVPLRGGLCLCDALRQTPLQIWADNLGRIVDGLKNPGDPNGVLQKEHEAMVHRISPRLPYVVQNEPRDWMLVGRIVTKAWTRYQYVLQQQQQGQTEENRHADAAAKEEIPPTVKIAIFGGSVTHGGNCITSVKTLGMGNCAWAARLGYFINRVAGGTVVEVWNGAMGATDTQIGTAILKFEMIPENMRHPDVIINAYSTNDNHIQTIDQTTGQEIALRDHIFAGQQEFVRVALRYQKCRDPPLVIFLDDYLGNGQKEIMATMNAGQGMQLLATYYGIGTVSYASMVRDIVYKNTRETSFSPVGWYSDQGGETMEREVHPPADMHVAVALSMSYYFLVLASTYCAMESATQQSIHTNNTYNVDDIFDTRALPPPLSPNTSLADISQLWRTSIQQVRSSDEAIESCDAYTESHPEALDRCTFTWISASPINNVPHMTIEDIFRPYLLETSKWKIDDVGSKPGWSPVDPTDLFVFESRIKSSADAAETRSLTLLYMKSWGDKWADSTAEVTVWNNGETLLAKRELIGFHDQRTSKTFRADFEFSTPAAPNSTLTIKARLVAGTTFKITGLGICSE